MFLNRTALGLEFNQDGASLVLAGKRGRLPVLERCESVSFPAGTLRLSLKEPNILDVPCISQELRGAYARLQTSCREVSVSLPDTAGRVLLLDLETRLKNKDDGADLIRWKLKKNLPFDINDIHLDYQVLVERPTGELTVLVALINRSVIAQYEELIDTVGLEPVLIDFSTFNLLRLFASNLGDGTSAVILWYKGVISILLFHDGILEFYRAKEIFDGGFDSNRIFREVNSSLLVYRDRSGGQNPQRIMFFSPQDDRAALQSVLVDATGMTPQLLSAAGVSGEVNSESLLHTCLAATGAATRFFV